MTHAMSQQRQRVPSPNICLFIGLKINIHCFRIIHYSVHALKQQHYDCYTSISSEVSQKLEPQYSWFCSWP